MKYLRPERVFKHFEEWKKKNHIYRVDRYSTAGIMYKELLEYEGFECIGSGLYKNVLRYRTHGYVVKIGEFNHIELEYNMSKRLPEKYVAQPMIYGPGILIQKFVEGKRCTEGCRPPLSLKEVGDWHAGNHYHVGKYRRPVVFDLGRSDYTGKVFSGDYTENTWSTPKNEKRRIIGPKAANRITRNEQRIDKSNERSNQSNQPDNVPVGE